MIMVLTKKDIQGGIKSKKIVVIPSLITPESDGEVEIRPISSVEWEEAEEIESKALGKIKAGNLNVDPHANKKAVGKQIMEGMKLDLDLVKMNKGEFDKKVRVVSLGLSVDGGDTWTEQEVKESLLKNTLEEIYEEILKLSGIPLDASQANEVKKELESFPEDTAGAPDSPE